MLQYQIRDITGNQVLLKNTPEKLMRKKSKKFPLSLKDNKNNQCHDGLYDGSADRVDS